MDYQTVDFVLRDYDGVSVIRFTAKNLTSPGDLERISMELEGLIDRGTHKMVLDFKHVEYISSAALGVLITVNKKMAAAKGKLVLSHTGSIIKLLQISQTERLFNIAADPKAAVAIM